MEAELREHCCYLWQKPRDGFRGKGVEYFFFQGLLWLGKFQSVQIRLVSRCLPVSTKKMLFSAFKLFPFQPSLHSPSLLVVFPHHSLVILPSLRPPLPKISDPFSALLCSPLPPCHPQEENSSDVEPGAGTGGKQHRATQGMWEMAS